MPSLPEYLRQQADAANAIADALEAGQSIDDLKWLLDLFNEDDWNTELARFHVETNPTSGVTAA